MKWFLPQKVIRPYAPTSVVARLRLQSRILPNLDRKLTLMVAPAGYGKTVLALELAGAAQHHDLWYELDEHDAHLEVFYAYLCEAVSQRVPDFSERLPEAPKDATPWELAGLLTVTLFELDEPILLILNNFHKVSDAPEITSFIDTLISYLPPTCHLMILSRNQTQLNLARLVANQEVNLLTQTQLAFTEGEALEAARALGCADAEAALAGHERLGGWPAGFTLLLGHGAAQLGGNTDALAAEELVAEDLVYAYLGSEVLGELSEREQRFAYLTALLAPFAETELTSYCTPDELGLLERLSKRHALLFTTGNTAGSNAGNTGGQQRGKPIYDLQPLVKDFLKESLARNHPELWRELNLRIGVGRFDEGQHGALENLVNAGAVAAIIERLGTLQRTLRESGDYSHFALWLRRLPEEALKHHPELLILMGEALVQRDAEAAKELYERALTLGVSDRRLHATALSGLLRAEHNLRRYKELLGRAPQVLEELRETRQLRELAFSYNSVARAHMSLGEYGAAQTAFGFVRTIGQELSDGYFEALATRGLASYADYSGDVQRSLLLNQKTLSYWEARANSYQIASTLNNVASCHYYLGDLHEGLAAGLRALSLWNELSLEASPVLLHCTLGDLHLGLAHDEDAEKHYRLAVNQSPSDAFSHPYALLGLARVYSLGAQRAKAERYVQHALELSLAHGFRFCEGLAQLFTAQLTGADEPLAAAEQIFTEIGAKRELTQVFWLRSERPGTGSVQESARYAKRAQAAEQALGYRARPPLVVRTAEASETPVPVALPQAPKAVLELFTCGHVEIVLNGAPVAINDWNGRKPRDIVLFLASTGVGASRDDFLDALWEEGGRDPEQQFSVALSRARRTLGWREAIVRDGNLYTFSPDLLVHEDAGTLERLRPGDPVAALMAALDTYQGDYLPGYYANWVEVRRRHLQEHALVLLSDLLPRLRDTQRHLVPTYAKLAFKLDPCHEPGYLELIRYHLDNRNPEQARRQYGNYQQAMKDLGLEPSPHLLEVLSDFAAQLGWGIGSRFAQFSDY